MDEKIKMELKQEIESMVTAIFSEKEEADIRRKTEIALQDSAEKIQELTTCLEERNEEIATSNDKIAENEEKIQNLESELEAAKVEIEEANTKLTEAETALEELKKDRAAELRMAELTEAKVGDYVLLHTGYAISIIDEDEAKENLKLFEEIAELVGEED